ncbi:MAG: polysialyltransferase family glycosyltransferase [Bacteroidia bacterium]
MKILLIVQPERFDFYSYLAVAENIEWSLLWYEKPEQMTIQKEHLPINFERICYWNEFLTPEKLLNELQPDKIVFFEIIDLRQIGLNVAALHRKIPTFYLEHGAAGDKETAINRWKEITFTKHKLPYIFKRFKASLLDVLRSKFFYYSVIKGFESVRSYIKFIMLPFQMLGGAPNKVLTANKFKERVPLKSIVFNKVNFNEYALYTGINPEDALFSGVPAYDKYYLKSRVIKDHLLFIDSPYMEENICYWTKEHHATVAKALFNLAEQRQIHIYIKLHPRSDASIWDTYSYNKDFVTIIQKGDYLNIFLEAKLILGFSSSLITAFLCARKNVVLLGWHPEPGIFGVDFSRSNLCHKSLNLEELTTKYDYWVSHNLTEENEEHYQNFLKEFNYPFDGRATDRVIKAITENGNS